jgi:hypothetical protein
MAGWRRERARRREERQWADAEIIADARQFLLDVDPVRRGLNANPSPGAEDAQWASLNQRREQVPAGGRAARGADRLGGHEVSLADQGGVGGAAGDYPAARQVPPLHLPVASTSPDPFPPDRH